MDFVGKRNWFFLFSFIVILPGVVFLIINPGLRAGIDFRGGSTMTVAFSNPVTQAEVRSRLASLGEVDATVQNFGDNTYFLRTRQLSESERESILNGLEASLSPDGVDVLSSDLVSPVVARETILNGAYAVIAAAVGIFIYLWWAFRSVPRPFRYGFAAIVALIHDLAIVVGIFAILGNLLGLEVNTMFLVAVLTVIGYSVNDTIVVFDRLRENVINYSNRGFAQNVNVSISETIGPLAQHEPDCSDSPDGPLAVRRRNDTHVPAGADYRCGSGHLQFHCRGKPGTRGLGEWGLRQAPAVPPVCCCVGPSRPDL